MKVKNPELYEQVKNIINKQYKKPSAYRSGAYIRLYKKMGGEFIEEEQEEKPLKRWFKEEWEDINPLKFEGSYPVYRPTKKISKKKTPLTIEEIDPENLIEQSIKKQIIKGESNLEPFKGGNVKIVLNKILKHLEEHLQEAISGESELDPKDLEHYKLIKKELKVLKGGCDACMKEFSEELLKYSNPKIAQKKAFQYLGKDAILYPSKNKSKKYSIYNPIEDKWVNFGQMGYEDFTKHKDKERRERYLKRATNMRGSWEGNKYSPNNLSIHILW